MVRKWFLVVVVVMVVIAGGCTSNDLQPRPSIIGGPVVPTPAAPPLHNTIAVSRVAYAVNGRADPSQNYGELFLTRNAAPKSLPLVMLIHGGAWGPRFGVHTLDGFARALANRGVAVFNVEYRRFGTGGGWPTTFTDATAAYDAATRLSSTHPQIRSSEVVVVGHSAGGQLATLTATDFGVPPSHPARSRPTAVIALAGAVDMAAAAGSGSASVPRIMGGSPHQFPDRYRAVDPISTINPGVRTTLIHGDNDRIVPLWLAKTYAHEANRLQADTRLVTVAGATHQSIVTPGGAGYDTTVRAIITAAQRE